MSFTVVGVNLLSPHTDRLRDGTPPQSERLAVIAPHIKVLGPDIVQVCEASSEKNVQELSERIELPIAAMRHQEDADEVIALLASADITGRGVATTFQLGETPGRFGTSLEFDDTIVIGVHYPWQVLRSRERSRITQALVKKSKTHRSAVILGDFNSLPQQRTRRLFKAAGFQAVSQTLPTRLSGFPAEYVQAQAPMSLASLIPKIQLDDIYARGLHLSAPGCTQTLSDHPILYATLLGDEDYALEAQQNEEEVASVQPIITVAKLL